MTWQIPYKLKENQYFKLAKADGWDAHTGKTINYRENVGKLVKAPKHVRDGFTLCSDTVIHATKDPLRWMNLMGLPFSLFVVEGIPTVNDENKCGFSEFSVLKEIPSKGFDRLLGFKYSEAINPMDPRAITPPSEIDARVLTLLQDWASVWASVRASVRASVWASVWASLGDSVWGSVWGSVQGSVWGSVWGSVRGSVQGSVWGSVWGSVRGSVKGSVWDSVKGSVWDSELAYIGTLFPQIKTWEYITHKEGEYPFQSAIELLKLGLVPGIDSYNETGYIFHPKLNDKAEILWKGPLEIAKKI